MRHTVKCFTKVQIDNVSLMVSIYYLVEKDKQLLNYRSILRNPNCNKLNLLRWPIILSYINFSSTFEVLHNNDIGW